VLPDLLEGGAVPDDQGGAVARTKPPYHRTVIVVPHWVEELKRFEGEGGTGA
jgi:hypothetical protein